MEQRSNFLALMLLDALEDENEEDIYKILERNNVDASFVTRERSIAPIHYVCGMPNECLSLKILQRFLELGADPNVRCVDNMTPTHIAAIYGRAAHVQQLLTAGARLDLMDDAGKLPVHYAIEECHVKVFEVMRDHIFCTKYEQKKKHNNEMPAKPNDKSIDELQMRRTPNKSCHIKSLLQPHCYDEAEDKFTPNKIHYNYDTTSPYYINITHRRHKPQPKYPAKESSETGYGTPPPTQSVNIFSLTRDNLTELNNDSAKLERSRVSLIETWRSKVEQSRARQSLMPQYEEIENFVEQAMQHDDFNCKQLKVKTKDTDADSGAESLNETTNRLLANSTPSKRVGFDEIVQQVAEACIVEPPTDSSFHTAYGPERNILQDPAGLVISQPRRATKTDEYFLQMTEAYVHTDDENGLVFYETKLLNNLGNKTPQATLTTPATPGTELNSSTTTITTNHTVPLDYETDALRAELTQFGERVGPITKSTKRLYIKRLIKYQRRNASQMLGTRQQTGIEAQYSVELQRTLRSVEIFEKIPDYFTYESRSAAHFVAGNASASKQNRQLREGHLKQSFIYMLIDPRISCNLPGESVYLDKFTLWKRFLESIFYVGKGKSSRPYAHLYDAMKTHTRSQQRWHQQQAQEQEITLHGNTSKKTAVRTTGLDLNSFKSPPAKGMLSLSKKLTRILDIWRSGQGVVCLHIFHNIMPTDAYTREAAIIDALGLRHLTNMKRGDYYGPAATWTMKQKKYLGIALLYKALHIFLAEGESQLSPSDLI